MLWHSKSKIIISTCQFDNAGACLCQCRVFSLSWRVCLLFSCSHGRVVVGRAVILSELCIWWCVGIIGGVICELGTDISFTQVHHLIYPGTGCDMWGMWPHPVDTMDTSGHLTWTWPLVPVTWSHPPPTHTTHQPILIFCAYSILWFGIGVPIKIYRC